METPSNLSLRKRLLTYSIPNKIRSIFEISLTLFLFLFLTTLAYIIFLSNVYIAATLIIPLALIQVRLFILQHDLGHKTLFKATTTNSIIGILLSIFTAVPYFYWRKCHAIHHATANNVHQQGLGSLDILTVDKYLTLKPINKVMYHLYRNPGFLLLIISWIYFYFYNRIPSPQANKHHSINRSDKASIYYTNVLVAAYLFTIIYFLGWKYFVIILVPIYFIAAVLGMLLFYIQHNFPDSYMETKGTWNATKVAMLGSSYFKLPKILAWFTGNIGYHHIHHLVPTIPFYKFPSLYRNYAELQTAATFKIRDIFNLFKYKLLDEKSSKIITWKEFKLL